MSERRVFDCHEAIAVAYPSTGRAMQGKVHLVPVPRAGVALSPGVHIEGEKALLALRSAIDHALRVESERAGARVVKEFEEPEPVLGRVAP